MQRVASRQRLFSWDHFDAHHHPSDNEQEEQEDENRSLKINCSRSNSGSADDDFSDYRTCISISRPASMIFQTSSHSFGLTNNDFVDTTSTTTPVGVARAQQGEGNSFVYVVSDDEGDDEDGELETAQDIIISSAKVASDDSMQEVSFQNVNQDVQFAIMSFLDLTELKALTLTCHHFNDLLTGKLIEPIMEGRGFDTSHSDIHSSSRNAIWWDLMKRTWPILQLGSEGLSLSQQKVNFVVQESITSQDMMPKDCKSCSLDGINYAALLSQAVTQAPSSIDPIFFQPTSIVQVQTLHLNEQAFIIRRRRSLLRKEQIYRSYELSVNLNDVKEPLRDNLGKQLDDNEKNSNDVKVQVVQYTGQVGIGDRSIRSNHPFPRPLEALPAFKRSSSESENEDDSNISYFYLNNRGRKRSLPSERASHPGSNLVENGSNSGSSLPSMNFLDRLRSCSKHSGTIAAIVEAKPHQARLLLRKSASKYPFVSPTVINTNTTEQNLNFRRFMEIDLTPRSIAYFEVSILPHDKSQEVNDNRNNNQTMYPNVDHLPSALVNNQNAEANSSCVAVGISTKDYSPSIRMPGWDRHSFAYHSDDGGIFHSKGDMIRVYGPRYDVGDTVGCGVNYQNGGIFFTLNGDFLGYAWCNEKVVLDCKEDLYPTVGVDSSNPLAINFGNKSPFVWDFPMFLTTNSA